MTQQKFRRGDLVHIAKDLGKCMSHFTADVDAIVIGSYADQFGRCSDRDYQSYTLMLLPSGGKTSWYEEHQLDFIRHVGEEGIAKVAAERDERCAKESQLDWIVANWATIRKSPSGASMGTLMKMIGIENPWGSHGEGVTYFSNAWATIGLLDEVLSTGDTLAVENYCRKIKSSRPVGSR
jgi:hypothetical protein